MPSDTPEPERQTTAARQVTAPMQPATSNEAGKVNTNPGPMKITVKLTLAR